MDQKIVLNSALPFLITATILVVIAILRLYVLFGIAKEEDARSASRKVFFHTILRWSAITWSLIIIIISSLCPSITERYLPHATKKLDSTNMNIYFIVDSSPSMKVKDNGYTLLRSELARKDMLDIYTTFPLAHYSLITYSDSARIDWPLSADNWSFSQRLRSFDAYDNTTPSALRGADPWDSAEYVRSQIDLSHKQNPLMDNFVFFFSSGDPLSTHVNDVKATTKFSEIPFIAGGYVFGYGTEQGGPIAAFRTNGNTVYVVDTHNHPVTIGIDQKTLRTISKKLDLRYIHRTPTSSVDNLLTKLRNGNIAHHFSDSAPNNNSNLTELYWILAAISALLLMPELFFLIHTAPWLSSLIAKVRKQ